MLGTITFNRYSTQTRSRLLSITLTVTLRYRILTMPESTAKKPVGVKKKTKTPKEVPRLGDPDRKRVLNVLAQRRYRERRKEKFAA